LGQTARDRRQEHVVDLPGRDRTSEEAPAGSRCVDYHAPDETRTTAAMTLVGYVIRGLARWFQRVGDVFRRVANLLYGFLPALLPPAELTAGLGKYYASVYTERFVPWAEEALQDGLEAWEIEVLDRYQLRKGRMLVLGSGWGREALAIARRGVSVVGIDTNEAAVRTAQRRADAAGVPARFHRASFLNLPYRSAAWDYVLMSRSMYSATPGAKARQSLLAGLVRVLKPEGLLILSFLPEQRPVSRSKRLATSMNRRLVKLPGANPSYQVGDGCIAGHFLHAFQDEAEISGELRGAGVVVREINWPRGFAVVAAPSSRPCR
ncbi:MAG: class I SAM-dependent methyltransferase, partial [bacterium]